MPYTHSIRKINKIDLNAMFFFIVYMKHRKVSSVGAILGCSGATVSVMLRRFCENFNDRVFERTSRNLTPTPFAHELLIKCESVMHGLCDIYIETYPDFKKTMVSLLELTEQEEV